MDVIHLLWLTLWVKWDDYAESLMTIKKELFPAVICNDVDDDDEITLHFTSVFPACLAPHWQTDWMTDSWWCAVLSCARMRFFYSDFYCWFWSFFLVILSQVQDNQFIWIDTRIRHFTIIILFYIYNYCGYYKMCGGNMISFLFFPCSFFLEGNWDDN